MDVLDYFGFHGGNSGWVTQCSFSEYFLDTVIPYVIRKRNKCGLKKCVILLDQCRAHLFSMPSTVPVILEENNIELLYFPAGYTRILQPLDVSVNAVLQNDFTKHFHPIDGEAMDKYRCRIWEELMKSCKTALTQRVIEDGFKESGIFPFDPSVLYHKAESYMRETIPEPAVKATNKPKENISKFTFNTKISELPSDCIEVVPFKKNKEKEKEEDTTLE